MKIDHVACWTENLESSCEFYKKYFGAEIHPPYHNPVKKLTTRFLEFPGGGRLELMHNPNIHQHADYSGQQHIGFIHLAVSVGSREKVDNLTEQLRMDGFPVIDGPRLTGDGYYESTILDPDGNRVEITV